MTKNVHSVCAINKELQQNILIMESMYWYRSLALLQLFIHTLDWRFVLAELLYWVSSSTALALMIGSAKRKLCPNPTSLSVFVVTGHLSLSWRWLFNLRKNSKDKHMHTYIPPHTLHPAPPLLTHSSLSPLPPDKLYSAMQVKHPIKKLYCSWQGTWLTATGTVSQTHLAQLHAVKPNSMCLNGVPESRTSKIMHWMN